MFDADYTICVKGKVTRIEKGNGTGYYVGIDRSVQGYWSRHRRLRGLVSFRQVRRYPYLGWTRHETDLVKPILPTL